MVVQIKFDQDLKRIYILLILMFVTLVTRLLIKFTNILYMYKYSMKYDRGG